MVMHWLLNVAILWFSISVVVIVTGWYAAVVIPVFCPEWWRRVVVDTESDYYTAQR
jgi:ABC-type Fe3+ transport system permease subunit